MRKILISAGDPSGDLLASLLVKELKALRPDVQVWAAGGPELHKTADVFVQDLTSKSMMGWLDPIKQLPYFLSTFSRLKKIMQEEKIDLVIPVDSYGFNIRVAAIAKGLGLPVIYFVSPQVWASRTYRVQTMKRFIDKVLCLFPFEESFYTQRGMKAKFVGHPLSEVLAKPSDTSTADLIGILPGSREGEIRRHMNVLLEVWKNIRAKRPQVRGVLYRRKDKLSMYPEEQTLKALGIECAEGPGYESRVKLDLALTASGMASLENMLMGVPQVVFYGVSPSWLLWVIRKWGHTKYMAMPNILAGYEVVPEIPWGVSASGDTWAVEEITKKALELLENPALKRKMKEAVAGLADGLRGNGLKPAQAAASEIVKILQPA